MSALDLLYYTAILSLRLIALKLLQMCMIRRDCAGFPGAVYELQVMQKVFYSFNYLFAIY